MVPEIQQVFGGFVGVLTIAGAFAVPIVGIVMFFVFLGKVIKAKHAEKIAMIEHGLTEAPRRGKGNGLLIAGVVFAAIGLGFVIGLPIAGAVKQVGVGLVPLFMGIGLIVAHRLTRKKEE